MRSARISLQHLALTFLHSALRFQCTHHMHAISNPVMPSLRPHKFLFTYRFSLGRGGAVRTHRPMTL